MKFAVISMQFAAKEDCRVAEAPRNDRSLAPTVPGGNAYEVFFEPDFIRFFMYCVLFVVKISVLICVYLWITIQESKLSTSTC